MAVDVKAYAERLAQEAGLAEDAKNSFLQVFSNEKVAKALNDDLMRHDDYSRQSDALRKKEEELGTWYQDVLKVTASNKEVVDNTQATLNAYRQKYGDLTDDGGKPLIASPTIDTKALREEYNTRLQTMEQNTLGLFKTGLKIATQHLKDFGEVLDTDALEKFAIENRLPLAAAYQQMIAPRLSDKKDKEFEEKLKSAREEGARDALSRHHLPTDPAPKGPHPFFDRAKVDSNTPAPTSMALRDEFVSAFREAGTAGAAKS